MGNDVTVTLLLENIAINTIQNVDWYLNIDNTYNPSNRVFLTSNSSNLLNKFQLLAFTPNANNELYAEADVTDINGNVNTYRAFLGNMGNMSTVFPIMPSFFIVTNADPNIPDKIVDTNSIISGILLDQNFQQFDWKLVPGIIGSDFDFSNTVEIINDTSGSADVIIPNTFPSTIDQIFLVYTITMSTGTVYKFSSLIQYSSF